MEHETGRPRVYIAQSEPMENTNIRSTHWHRRMARKIGDGEMSRGFRIAVERYAEMLGLVDMLEKPKKKNGP